MLSALKNLNLDRSGTEELIEMFAVGTACVTTYAHFSVPAPEWLTESLRQLEGEIGSRRRDMLIAREREISRSLAGLRSREERRHDLEAELATVRGALGSGGQTTP